MATHAQLQTRGRDSLDAVDPASLARLTTSELDQLFAELDPATLRELQGRKRGRVLAVPALDWLPAPARASLFRVINRLPIWQGEHLDGEYGSNAWLLPGGAIEFGRYLAREAPATDGEGTVIRLDYDVAANPGPVRRVVAELRHLGPGLFLGRLRVSVGRRELPISYFMLEG